MSYNERLQRFQSGMDGKADCAFLPMSADLQYLTGVPRDIPNFGAVMHPGAWLEGAWIAPGHAPVLLLPRMTAEFGGLSALQNIDIRILGDWDDPAKLVRSVLDTFALPAQPRVAVSDHTTGETSCAT